MILGIILKSTVDSSELSGFTFDIGSSYVGDPYCGCFSFRLGHGVVFLFPAV